MICSFIHVLTLSKSFFKLHSVRFIAFIMLASDWNLLRYISSVSEVEFHSGYRLLVVIKSIFLKVKRKELLPFHNKGMSLESYFKGNGA